MTWARKALGASIVGALCVALAACGGGGSASSTASGPSAAGAGPSSGQFAKFTQCLREHGVNIPTTPGGSAPPQSGQNGYSATPPSSQQGSAMTSALAACRSLMPAGGPQGPPAGSG